MIGYILQFLSQCWSISRERLQSVEDFYRIILRMPPRVDRLAQIRCQNKK